MYATLRHAREVRLAFTSKLWWQKGKGTRFGNLQNDPAMVSSKAWSFKCHCEWGYLQEEALLKPKSEAAKWYAELATQYGLNYNMWPRVGCQQGFRAYKNGASMVMELKIGRGIQSVCIGKIARGIGRCNKMKEL